MKAKLLDEDPPAVGDAAFLFDVASLAHSGDLLFAARGSSPVGVVLVCARASIAHGAAS